MLWLKVDALLNVVGAQPRVALVGEVQVGQRVGLCLLLPFMGNRSIGSAVEILDRVPTLQDLGFFGTAIVPAPSVEELHLQPAEALRP